MTKRLEIYKCEICGNIVEMVHGGRGTLVCCAQPMQLFEENTVDADYERSRPERTAISTVSGRQKAERTGRPL